MATNTKSEEDAGRGGSNTQKQKDRNAASHNDASTAKASSFNSKFFTIMSWGLFYLSLTVLYESSQFEQYRVLSWAVLQHGGLVDLIAHVWYTKLIFHDRLLFKAENFLFPGEDKEVFKTANRVFVLGHDRSGSTNVYNSIIRNAEEQLAWVPLLSILLHSSVLRDPLRFSLQQLLDEKKNDAHVIPDLDMPCEGHHTMHHHYKTEATFVFYSSDVINAVTSTRMNLFSTDFNEDDFSYYDSIRPTNPGKLWIDKPLTFLSSFDEMYKFYPDSKYIIMERNPKDCLESSVHLTSQLFDGLDSENEHYVRMYSLPRFENIRKAKTMKSNNSEQFLIVQFEDYVANSTKVLAQIYDFLELDPPKEWKIAPREKHRENPNYKRPALKQETIDLIAEYME